MNETSPTTQMVTGALAFLVLAGIFVLTYAGSVAGGGDGNRLNAWFRNVDGLPVGADVRLAGIPVGSVAAVSYDSGTGQVLVTLAVDDSVPVPVDSVAMIVSESLLGSKYLKIEPGGEYEIMADGGTFEYTQNSVIFEDILQTIIREVEAARAANDAPAGDASGQGD